MIPKHREPVFLDHKHDIILICYVLQNMLNNMCFSNLSAKVNGYVVLQNDLRVFSIFTKLVE